MGRRVSGAGTTVHGAVNVLSRSHIFLILEFCLDPEAKPTSQSSMFFFVEPSQEIKNVHEQTSRPAGIPMCDILGCAGIPSRRRCKIVNPG